MRPIIKPKNWRWINSCIAQEKQEAAAKATEKGTVPAYRYTLRPFCYIYFIAAVAKLEDEKRRLLEELKNCEVSNISFNVKLLLWRRILRRQKVTLNRQMVLLHQIVMKMLVTHLICAISCRHCVIRRRLVTSNHTWSRRERSLGLHHHQKRTFPRTKVALVSNGVFARDGNQRQKLMTSNTVMIV